MTMLFVTIGIALAMIGGYFFSVLRNEDKEKSRDRDIELEDEPREQPVGPRG